MDYIKIVIFIELLLIGLSSSGSILTGKFGKFSNLNGLIFSYSIFIILTNYAYFKLNLSISLIFWIFFTIFISSITYLFIYDRKKIIREINIIIKISFIPLSIFLLLSLIYGEQYYVFRGNYWDYFNYISTALLILKNNFSEILNINDSSNISIFLKIATEYVFYRPSASLLLGFFLNINASNFFIIGFAFKFFLIILILISTFNLLSSLLKKENFYSKLFYSLCFCFSFWTFYIYEIDALSHLASIPLFIFLVNQTMFLFDNLNKKNYFFLTIFLIVFASLFIVYVELACVYAFLFLIYSFLSKDCNFTMLKKNLKIITVFSFIFITITFPLYEFTFKFLTMQINEGFTHKNNWWAYYGGFIIGRENPIISDLFVSKLQSLIDYKLSLYELFSTINIELINHNYKHYFLNIIPSFFGLYYLTDVKFLLNNETINIIYLIFLNLIVLIYFIKNFANIIKFNSNLILLIKSYFIILTSFSLILIFLNQYWSIIKLYFYLSLILWLFLVSNFKINNNVLELRINRYVILLLIIFPIYKLSTFNAGITRYDAFPSILSKESKKEINWSFKDGYFKNCDSITLNFYENNKINRFKNLYLSLNLIFNDYKFINKYTLKKMHAAEKKILGTEENNCEINNDYFEKLK